MAEPNLITSVVLQGREYLVKMNVVNKYLELVISDKQTGEEWQCNYDHAYIENLTHKTGNFKQYDVFVTMIKSGLLKTSDSISLELLTFEDLDTLRTKKVRSYSRHFNNTHGNNRRYLIVTYSVEFDRIHYPLPLEYCGPPDPTILQATIRKLEGELARAKEELSSRATKVDQKQILVLQRRVDELQLENSDLKNEISELQLVANNGPKNQVKMMQRAIVNLEKSVLSERKSHHQVVDRLRNDKIRLLKELEKCRSNENSLRIQLDEVSKSTTSRPKSLKGKRDKSDLDSLETIFRRLPLLKSRSDDTRRNTRTRSLSPRVTKSDGCEQYRKKEKNRKKSTKPRSRSSSLSNSQNLENFFAMAGEGGGDNSSAASARRGRKKSTASRSRSSSRDSTENSASYNYKSTSTWGIKSRLRGSDRDFLALENRIQALQDILKDHGKTGTI